jgi:calcium binding protein 39
MVEFLTKFHTERTEDEQFNDEKAYLIKQIQEMKPVLSPTTATSATDEQQQS